MTEQKTKSTLQKNSNFPEDILLPKSLLKDLKEDDQNSFRSSSSSDKSEPDINSFKKDRKNFFKEFNSTTNELSTGATRAETNRLDKKGTEDEENFDLENEEFFYGKNKKVQKSEINKTAFNPPLYKGSKNDTENSFGKNSNLQRARNINEDYNNQVFNNNQYNTNFISYSNNKNQGTNIYNDDNNNKQFNLQEKNISNFNNNFSSLDFQQQKQMINNNQNNLNNNFSNKNIYQNCNQGMINNNNRNFNDQQMQKNSSYNPNGKIYFFI